MQAVRFHEYGAPEVLRVEDVPEPAPGPGEVRVRVAGSAFNPLDAGIRGGWVREAFPVKLPHVPGYDVSGTVDVVGDGVGSLEPGRRVVGFLAMTEDGGAAQYLVAPAADLVSAPAAVPLVDAAALPSPALTARQALDAAGLVAGQRILIIGAGGAVGGYAVQLAVLAGAVVVAASGPGSADRLRALGASDVVATSSGPAAVGEPVDVLLNLAPIGADGLRAYAGRVRAGGVVVNTVPSAPLPEDEGRDLRTIGFFVRRDSAALADLVAMVDRGELRIDVAEHVALADLGGVHARSDAGELRGKVVVVPPEA